MSETPGRSLTASLAWAGDGATHLRDLMMRMGDDAFRAPSGLPGWSRAHLLSHVARNADALSNLLTWARTGVPTPAYVGKEQRTADIEAGAARSPAEIRADVVATSDRLATMVRDMPERAWTAEVEMWGRRLPAADIAWLRAVETWVHSIDLDVGSSFADLPRPMLLDLVTEIAAHMSEQPDCPSVRIVADDRPESWQIGPAGEPGEPVSEVQGSAAQLAAWLSGRSRGRRLRRVDGRQLPVLPLWR